VADACCAAVWGPAVIKAASYARVKCDRADDDGSGWQWDGRWDGKRRGNVAWVQLRASGTGLAPHTRGWRLNVVPCRAIHVAYCHFSSEKHALVSVRRYGVWFFGLPLARLTLNALNKAIAQVSR
jgi:hypothetical protein